MIIDQVSKMEISTKENNIKSQQRSTMVLQGILSIVFMCFFLEPVSSLRFPHLDAFDAVSTEDVHVEISEHFLSSNRERRSSLPFPEKIKLQLRSKRFSPIITLQKNFNARTWIPIRYHNNDTYLNEPNDGSEPYETYMDKMYDASALVTRTNGRLEVMMEFYIDGRQFFVVTKLDPSNTEDIIHTLVEPRNLLSLENDYKHEGQDPPIDHERLKRETAPVSTVNKIELLIFVDFSLYKFWKELTPKNGTNKEQVALRMIEQYYAFMGSAVNQRYQNINDSTLNIQVEVVGIIIAQNEAGSPWTEKNSNSIDANQTLVEFGNYIKANRKSLIGHDHAVLLTRYDIVVSGNPNAAGFAFLSTLCRDNSVSVVEDQFNFVSLTVITHEIGHSLSATHDGTGVNICNGSLGYIMATVNSPTTGSMAYNQWLFSDCSKTEFQNYIQKLDETSSNCMKRVDDLNHNNYTVILPGTQYTADEQCIIMRDEKDSYMCRTSYIFEEVFDYSSICTGMLCKVSSSSTCSMALPADGTPCGSKKWCINGRCVQSDSVPSTCIHGDQKNEVYNGMGCSAFVLPSRYNCKDPKVREVCCMSCQICLPGSYQPSVSSALCMPCPAGSYQTLSNSTACIPCSPGTYQNQTGSSSPCSLCQAGTFQNLTGQVNCVSCPVGYYQPIKGSSTCLLCNAGSYQPQTGSSSCTPCQVGSYQNLKGQGSCIICPTGTTTDTTGSTSVDNCYPVCPAGSYRPSGVSYCMTCTAGMYQPATGQKSCLPCQSGTYQNLTGQTSCKFCAVGTNQTSSGSTSCTPCKQGYYQPNEKSQVCIACSAGWYQPSIGASSCNQCEIGSYQSLQGQGSCIKCPTGKTTDAIGSTSVDNCYSVVRFIGTLKINRNYKPTYENKSSTDFKTLEQELTIELDKACRNGTLRSFCKYSKLTSTRNGSIVAETELGYLANPLVTEISVTSSMMQTLSKSSSSIAQAINTSFIAFSQLSACSAGSYRSPAVSECVACATGMFQLENGQTSCVPCQPGTYQNLTGQTSCKSCIVGTYQANEKSQVCIACSAGWYQPSPGASSCNQCEIGSYQSLQGQNSCIKCPANKTTDATGSKSVENCYSVARFVGTLKINRNYKATYGDKSSTDFKNLEQELTTEMDKVCRNGSLKSFCKYSKLTNARNGSILAETELGYLANPLVTEISVTSSMMQALSQSSSSIAQAINTSFTAFSQLSACSAGSYRSPAVSECVACATGMFQPESGQTSCVPCQPGTYQNRTGQTSCKSCIVGTYQANEKSQVCIACSAGWYQPSPGASSCNQCEIGSYQSLQGQNSCIKCPANKTTDATGSTSVDNCYSVARFVGTLKINRDYKATYGDKSSTDFKNLEQELTTEMDKVCRNGSLKSFCKYSKLINTRNGSIVAETELGYMANPLVTEISVTSSMTQALSQSSSSIAQEINTSFTAFSQLSDPTTTTTSTTKAPISTPSFIMGNEKRLPEWVIPVAASIGGALVLGVVIAMCCSSCRKGKETKEDIDYHHTQFNKTYASALFEHRYIKGKPDTEQHKGKKHLDTRGGLSRGDERSKRTSSDDKYSSDFRNQDPYSAPHTERNNRRNSHYNHQSGQLVTNSEAPFYISGKNDIMNRIMIDSENEYRRHSPRHHKKHQVHGHRQMNEYDW